MLERNNGNAPLKGEDFVQRRLLKAGESEILRGLEGLRCEGDDYEKLINSNGYPHCVQCRPEMGETTQVVRVSYDYEMLYDDTESLIADIAAEILPRFEWGLMDQVSTQFYLCGCQLSRQKNTDKFTITGLSSLYLDFRDISVEECEFLSNDSPFLKCAPVAGSMTVEYVGDAGADEVADALLKEINTVMSENRGTGGAVKSVFYVGNRQEVREDRGGISAASSTEGEKEAIGTASIATSASAVVLILILVGAAMFVWRNKSDKKNEIDHHAIDVENPPEEVEVLSLDCELPSTPPRKAGITAPVKRGTSDDGLENTDDQVDDMSDAAVADPVEERDAVHSSIVPPPSITRSSTPPQVATFTSSGSSDDNAAEIIVASAAVPPPKDAKSETLKKHRKKKKKKKNKVTLVRVNSRENIASMETISETDEQEGQDNLEEDLKSPGGPVATYSTSDDESSACSTASSDNEQDDEEEVVQPLSQSPVRSRRGDLPPLPPVEF